MYEALEALAKELLLEAERLGKAKGFAVEEVVLEMARLAEVIEVED